MKQKILNSIKQRAKKPFSGEAGVQVAVIQYLKWLIPMRFTALLRVECSPQ